MDTKTLTLQIPISLYEHYKQRAEQAQRSIEDEVLEVVSASATPEGISPELAKEIEGLKSLSDEALHKLIKQGLPAYEARKAEQLHFKAQREGSKSVTPPERELLDDWLRHYDSQVLIRSHVLLLLKQRGYDLDALLKPR